MDWTVQLKSGKPDTLTVDHEVAAKIAQAIGAGDPLFQLRIPNPGRKGATLFVIPTANVAMMTAFDDGIDPKESGFRIG